MGALLPEAADLTDIPERLAALLGHSVTVRCGVGLPQILFGKYGFFIALDADSAVNPDLDGVAARTLKAVGTPEEQIRKYPYLLSIGGTKSDPQMNHFNDSIFLAEAVERLFPGAILYHPETLERM
ncbi:hypothetical protein [Deinococcus ruber]|uniref:Uncharacterized protein n=1 Tax=Deinococcus ruber TaxID=1848197 RepID=A0A918CIG4_9DEIO|nr:hypothetical protein [Deinococcus ruber]GGR24579.1 hypothetical protein GCM10008957_40340 [Deinococcus ruber]